MDRQPIRLLGYTLEKVGDFRSGKAKNAGLYAALARRYDVLDVVRPELTGRDRLLNRIRSFHPVRARWVNRTYVNLWAQARRTALGERLLQQWDGHYDLIVQIHTVAAPGLDLTRRPYVLHTDNTYILSERHYPPWATLGHGPRRDEWVRREGEIYRNAAFLFPRSEFLRRSMIEDYGCDPERVVVVGGGSNFSPAPLDGKRYDTQTAIFVGGDFERKGGHVLLEAWPHVRRALPEARLWIVGPKRPARELPGVEWLGFISDREELARRYREATCFVMPSIFEPWGFVFFEAMSFGLACIGSSGGAMPELIAAGETGLLAEVGRAEPLAASLIALLGNPAAAEAMGREAHRRTASQSTWDDVVGRMAPHIEAAVAQQRGDR